MTSQDLTSKYQFVGLDQWVEVGPFILGLAAKDEIAMSSLPEGTVVFAMRFCGDPALLQTIGYGLPKGTSDIVYVGYSAKLGVKQTERLHNMRHNELGPNVRIRDGTGKVYNLPSARVEIGWRFCKDRAEALQLARSIKEDFYANYGQRPPWNR